MVYVPRGSVEEVEHHLGNLQAFRRVLGELCEINRELLKRREKL